MGYKINRSLMLSGNQGDSRKAKKNIIVLHDVGNPGTSGLNNAKNAKNNYTPGREYVTFYIDGETVYEVGTEGYVAWGAGSWANDNAVVQIEIDNSKDKNHFKKSYKTFIDLTRDMAKKYDIDLDLDLNNDWGIKSHKWISDNKWGDHQDPYDYLKSMGISKAQLAKDLKNGISSAPSTPNKPSSGYGNAKVGNNVKVASFASKYATGQKIPKFVKGGTYKVMQKTKKPQSKSTYRYLLGTGGVATGWFLGQDIQAIK